MTESIHTCPDCGDPLILYANGDNGPADDRWTCDQCGVEYPHTRFPLPKGYVRAAKKAEQMQALADQQADERWKLARWNEWATQDSRSAPIAPQEPVQRG